MNTATNLKNAAVLKIFDTYYTFSCRADGELHMAQHVADWVAPFPRSQHPTPPLLIFLHAHHSPHPSSSLLYVGGVITRL